MKVTIFGDYVPRERIAQMMGNGDFSYFDEIRKVIKDSDLAIMNLEAPIVLNGARPIDKCGPNLKTSEKVVDSLNYAGVRMVTLANNHIMDFGDNGLQDTLSCLENGNISHVGVGKNLVDAAKIGYQRINGETLAVINCCEHEFSIATNDSSGANPLNPIQQYHKIKEAKANADFVLVIVHGGHEHWQLPSPRMVETYRYFIEIGADAVVNHHQHCYSGYETYLCNPIFYGLGNLCFEYSSRKSLPWNYGFAVTLDFTNDSIGYKIHPYEQCSDEAKVKMLDENSFDERLSELNGIIQDNDKLNNCTIEYYTSNLKSIQSVYEPFGGRALNLLRRKGWMPSLLTKKKKLIMENCIMCEAHRDKTLHWLNRECVKQRN